jgi:hypothetical protein
MWRGHPQQFQDLLSRGDLQIDLFPQVLSTGVAQRYGIERFVGCMDHFGQLMSLLL